MTPQAMLATMLDGVGIALPYFWLMPVLYCLTSALLVPAARRLHDALASKSTTKAAAWKLDLAEKGTLVQKATMLDQDIFELEKRAFLSKARQPDAEKGAKIDDGRHGCLYATEIDLRRQETMIRSMLQASHSLSC